MRTAEEARTVPQGRSLSELYERHIRRAVGLARLLTNDDAAAEDIAQEAFIRAAGRFAHLRRPDAFGGYLRATVVNLCRARIRRRRVERDWLRRQRAVDQVSTPAFDPDDRAVVWRAVSALPWRQREAVVLRYYEDLSIRQTAEVLRCSPGAVESLVSRASAALRESLGEEEQP